MSSLDLKLWASEPVFVNLLRSPGIDSQPGGRYDHPICHTGEIDSSEFIPGLLADFENLEFIFCSWVNYFMGHFSEYFEGAPTFLTPQNITFNGIK